MKEPTFPGDPLSAHRDGVAATGAHQSAGTLRDFMARGRSAQTSVNAILDEHERSSRSNASNDGRSFQKEIERTCGAYQSRRTATIRKVDPPTRLVGTGADRKVLFMANPFLDFVGSWTSRHGRAIVIEAKSTANHRLPFKRPGGLTDVQLTALKSWRHAGAACALLWRFNGRVALFTPEMLLEAEGRAAKSLLHESGRPVPPGEGFILWDFLAVLEAVLWPQNSCQTQET